jgi:hypothetical protein
MGHSPVQAMSELDEAIERLLEAHDAAKRAPDQDVLVKLIEAVLLHAGRELVKATFPDDPLLDGG